jgi:hypothetical protein
MPREKMLFPSLALLLILTSCGASRQMQSISITPTIGNGVNATFTATGTFNRAPTPVSPVSASWYLLPDVDPPPASYSLSAGKFVATRCPNQPVSATFTIIALAPVDPNASSNGKVPSQVMHDLVYFHTQASEGGFVAATAKLTCQ